MITAFPDKPKAPAALDAGQGRIIWLTGSSPEERARFGRKARERFAARGRASFVLDDTTLRDGLSSDLGASERDEAESRRRTLEVAKLLSRAGVTVLVALEAAGRWRAIRAPSSTSAAPRRIGTGSSDDRRGFDWARQRLRFGSAILSTNG